jgi:hypothetical protein
MLEPEVDNQVAARLKRERPTCTERAALSKTADGRVATVATRQEKNLVAKKLHLTPTGLLMEGHFAH